MAVDHPADQTPAGGEAGAPRRSGGHKLSLGLIFATIAFVLAAVGWHFEHIAFTPPPPASQMYAAVFVRDPAARVSLSATVFADTPWRDKLAITVAGASARKAGWVLLIECPAGAPSLPRSVHLYSETGTVSVTVPQQAQVTAYPRVTSATVSEPFSCFSASPPPGTPGYPPSLGNVALPALQTDQAISLVTAAPVLYAQQDRPGTAVSQLFQIFPGAPCPTATPSVSASATPSTSPSVSPSASPTVSSASASLTPTVTASGSAASTASPSASSVQATTSPAATASPGCYPQAPIGAAFVRYSLPQSVTTTETLKDVNIQGYQVNSMFPVGSTTNEDDGNPGQITRETITWSGLSGLSPSLEVTDTAGATNAGRDTFWAGILVGLAGGFAVPFVDRSLEAMSEKYGAKLGKWRRSRSSGPDAPTDQARLAGQDASTDRPDLHPKATDAGQNPPDARE
jgi:hypothetical protein